MAEQQTETTSSTARQYPVKLFDQWECATAEISDPGLKRYINVDNILVPKSRGRHADQQFKSEVHIVERLMNRLYVSGHKGKKHFLSSGSNTGKSSRAYRIVKDAFEIVHEKTGENPVQVLVTAVEHSAPKEEVVTYRRGGIMARKAVIVSPQRRVDLALRHLGQGAYTSRDDRSAAQALADNLLKAYNNDRSCKAVREKERREKEASGAR